MTTLEQCADLVAEELGKTPEEQAKLKAQVRDIAKRLQAERRKAAANGLDPDAEVQRLIAQQAGEARIKAAKARKSAAKNVIIRDAADAQIAEVTGQGIKYGKSLVGFLNGIYGGWKSGRNSVANRRGALESAYIGGLHDEIQRTLPHVIKMMRRPVDNAVFFGDVVREWRKPGSTKSTEARQVAEVFAKHTELARLDHNRAGGNVGKLADWGGPQAWDPARLLKVTEEQFVDDMMTGGLDVERAFGAMTTDEEARAILKDVYLTITTGVPTTPTARERGAFVGQPSGVTSMEQHRVLHFRTADDWLGIHAKYGRGNVVNGVMDHLRSMARSTALMEKLGPNPRRMFESLIEDQRRIIRDSKMTGEAKNKALVDLTLEHGQVKRAWAVASGDVFRPGDFNAARRWTAVRQIQSMAKLGTALPSQFADLMTYAQAMRWQGRGLLQGYSDAFHALVRGRVPADIRHIAMLSGVGHETFLGEIHGGYGADDAAFGWLSRKQDAFFKLNGMHWWTDTLTTTFAAMSSVDMAHQSGKAWDNLNIGYRTTLAEYGIGEADWGKVRNMVSKEGDYSFVWPEQAGDHELEMRLRSYFQDTATFAVINGDDRTRQWTTGGERSGTNLGETIRFMMQFKSFSVAYTQKFLGPMLRGAPGRRDLGGIPHLIAMSLAFGYVAGLAKDVMKNKTPKDPGAYKTWLAALTQSGGAGIYGDFLFSNADRFGGGFLAKAAGPVIGTAFDVGEMVVKDRDELHRLITGELKNGNKILGDAVYMGLNNTPFLNLHFTRAALDLAILNSFQEWVSPGTFRRREKTMRKEYGQHYMVDPV